jgi:hypothetical protein
MKQIYGCNIKMVAGLMIIDILQSRRAGTKCAADANISR